MRVLSLGQEDPLEEEIPIHSSTLCLENPMDKRAWWAAVYRSRGGQSRTALLTRQWAVHFQRKELNRLRIQNTAWCFIVFPG